jgi:hypothetical protein
MSSSLDTTETRSHLEIMRVAAENVYKVADVYIATYSEAKKSLFGKSHTCQKEARSLKVLADDFLKQIHATNNDNRTQYFFFVRDFIETYNIIPRHDSLSHLLQKNVLNHFQMSLNTLLQLRSENTSQEYLAPYIILVKVKLSITTDEEQNRKHAFDNAS